MHQLVQWLIYGLNSGVSFQSFIGGMDDLAKKEGVFPQFNSASGGYSYGFNSFCSRTD